MTNRIIRRYVKFKDHFLRIIFVDENFGSILQATDSEKLIDGRVRQLVRDGIVVAGHKFIFLAYSNSQLREQGCWFYCEERMAEQPPSAEEIRRDMGQLDHIRIVSKHAARLGQGLSSSIGTVSLRHDQVESHYQDVERNGFCFSDGVGIMTRELALEAANHLKQKEEYGVSRKDRDPPSAFQIRFKGSKGVISVHPPSVPMPSGCRLALRKSMTKFEGNDAHDKLEVLAVAKAMKCYLNRQIITILSNLGIADGVFMTLLDDMIHQLCEAMDSNELAKRFLIANGGSPVSLMGFN